MARPSPPLLNKEALHALLLPSSNHTHPPPPALALLPATTPTRPGRPLRSTPSKWPRRVAVLPFCRFGSLHATMDGRTDCCCSMAVSSALSRQPRSNHCIRRGGSRRCSAGAERNSEEYILAVCAVFPTPSLSGRYPYGTRKKLIRVRVDFKRAA